MTITPAPLTRRSVLQAGMAGAATAWLAACGSGTGAASATGAPQTSDLVSSTTDPETGVPDGVTLAATQTATFALSNLPTSIDPHAAAGRCFDLYETLTDPDPTTGEPRPFLATSWTQIDDTTWEFTLRDDVRFHDGSTLTADDVVFSYQRGLGEFGGDYYIASQANTVEKVTAVDDQTVRIVTTSADLLLPKRAAQVAIMPKAYYEGLGSDTDSRDAAFLEAPIGSGPYKLSSFESGRVVVEKADTTWRSPTLTEITFLSVTDTGSQLNSLLAGDVQYVNLMPLTAVTTMEANNATIINIQRGNDLGAFMYSVDTDGKPKDGPMGSAKVRQALQYAVNKQELVDDVLNGATYNDNGQLIGPDLVGYNESLTEFGYDLDKAGQLLDDAGYPEGSDGSPRFSLTMASAYAGAGSVRRLVGEYYADAFGKLNIDVDYTALTDSTVATDYFYGNTDRPDILHFGLYTRPYMDAARAYNYFTQSEDALKVMANDEFDELYEQQLAEFDEDTRAQTLDRMAEIMQEESCFLFACGDVWIDAAVSTLRGLTACESSTMQYYSSLYLVDEA